MTDVGFAYSARWSQFGPGVVPEATVTALELRDRELEQFLDAPAQVAAGRLFTASSPFTDVSGYVADFRVRWERQRGQWVSFEAQGRGAGVGLPSSAAGACVALPAGAAPLATIGGVPAALGSQVAQASSILAGLVVLSVVNGTWCVATELTQGWGAVTDDWFYVHVMYLAQQ